MANSNPGEAIAERLERLRRATTDIAPTEGFASRVGSAVLARQRRRGPLLAVVPIGSRALVAGVLAAAAALLAAYHAETPPDDEVVVASDTGWWEP